MKRNILSKKNHKYTKKKVNAAVNKRYFDKHKTQTMHILKTGRLVEKTGRMWRFGSPSQGEKNAAVDRNHTSVKLIQLGRQVARMPGTGCHQAAHEPHLIWKLSSL